MKSRTGSSEENATSTVLAFASIDFRSISNDLSNVSGSSSLRRTSGGRPGAAADVLLAVFALVALRAFVVFLVVVFFTDIGGSP